MLFVAITVLCGLDTFFVHDLHASGDDCQFCHVNNVCYDADDSVNESSSLVSSHDRIKSLETVILKSVCLLEMGTRGPPA